MIRMFGFLPESAAFFCDGPAAGVFVAACPTASAPRARAGAAASSRARLFASEQHATGVVARTGELAPASAAARPSIPPRPIQNRDRVDVRFIMMLVPFQS